MPLSHANPRDIDVSPANQGAHQVLIVDDRPWFARLLTEMLSSDPASRCSGLRTTL